MNKKQITQFSILATCGVLAVFAFAVLWFRPDNIPHNFHGYWRIFDVLLYLAVTYVIWLPICMKMLLWAVASHIKSPIPPPPPELGKRVAFVTTYVPGSESLNLLHRILPTLVGVKYPHDTWLLDEGGSAEVKAICRQYGVNHFSRNGIEFYNAPDGKFARKTKGGNHNSWYDRVGDNYDYVAQIDTDFIVHPEFLLRTLGYFRDPSVAFVGTPQIYGNTHHSLIARGAAEQTYNFYGPLLRGMAGMDSTLLIGANHVIRVAALKSVGHYSAHITEDLLTGMKLHANGWQSIYVPQVLAIGEGPSTWKAYFSQQRRWAYGCMHILFNHSFKLFETMSLRRMAYYFAIQQYYFTGVAMLLGLMCICLYFYTGIESLSIDFFNFLASYLSIVLVLGMVALWLQRFNVRPDKEKGFMWAGMYIGMAVWPVYLMAFLRVFRRKQLTYKVTPKGIKITKPAPSSRLFIPHFILGTITLVGLALSVFTHRDSPLMVFWAVVTGGLLLASPVIPPVLRKLRVVAG